MMKEKVNTHFSFPMKLNMAAYTEEYLLATQEVGGNVAHFVPTLILQINLAGK